MPRNGPSRQQVMLLLSLAGFVVGLQGEEIHVLEPKQAPTKTRVLSFPADQCMGNLYCEPESGPGWNPKLVGLSGVWDYLNAAQGDVKVPNNKNIQLDVVLPVMPMDAERLKRQSPMLYHVAVAHRIRKDPRDLAVLASMEPNDLFRLTIGSATASSSAPSNRRPGFLEPISHLKGLQMLQLCGTGVSDNDLKHLTSLSALKTLELFPEHHISKRGISFLKELTALEYLDLPEDLTDSDLREVANIANLHCLRIRAGRIWGPGLASLSRLTNLERLCIWGNRPISDRHIPYLEGLKQLKSLTLWGVCDSLTDTSLASIGKLNSLEELYFIRTSPQFSSKGVAHLRSLTKLKKLDFGQTFWTDGVGMNSGDMIARQLATQTNLVSLKWIGYLSNEGLRALASLRHLQCLQLNLKDQKQNYHGPSGISFLTQLDSLEELSISTGDMLADSDLESLGALPHLKRLVIGAKLFSPRGVAAIGSLTQLESLVISSPENRCTDFNPLNGLVNLRNLQIGIMGHRMVAQQNEYEEAALDLSGLTKLKSLDLSVRSLTNQDLVFLHKLPMLEDLMLQPESKSHLTGELLTYLADCTQLKRLYVDALSNCTNKELSVLRDLTKLRSLTLKGNITENNFAVLDVPSSLSSVDVETDHPISKKAVTDFVTINPSIEYVHIYEPDRAQNRTRPQESNRAKLRRSKQRYPLSNDRKRR